MVEAWCPSAVGESLECVADLAARLRRAVERRQDTGWPHVANAEAAAAALTADTAAGAGIDLAARLLAVHRQFDLTDAEVAVLEVAATAEQSVSGHLLLGLLAGDDHPGRPTVALALELAGVPANARGALRHLGEQSPLVRYGLVSLVGTDVLLSRRIVVTSRVSTFLACDDMPTRTALELMVDAVAVPVEGTTLIASALKAGQRLVWVHAPGGSAGSAMAVAACQQLGLSWLVADLDRLDPDAAIEDAVLELLVECGLAGTVLVLAGAERARVSYWKRSVVPVVAISREPWDPAWPADLPLSVSAPRLTTAERQAVWESMLGELGASREVTGMLLSPEQIVAVGRHAAIAADLHGETAVTAERVTQSARELSRGRSVRANASSSATLQDLVLPPAALAEVMRMLDWVRYRDEVTAMGPLHGKGGKGIGICALFSGPPGTGKTLAAHVVADSLGMDLYQVDLSTIVDKYIGETEKNLERVFIEAEATNAVLFFDEADALFGSRSAVKDAKDRYANQEIAYLLQRMEHFDGITVLASNLRGNLDPAFTRRLHFMIAFPEPDERTRARLWHHHLDGVPHDAENPIDVERLSKNIQFAGGDIRNVVLSSVYAAVAEGSAVGMRHVADAVRREHIKLGRRPPSLD